MKAATIFLVAVTVFTGLLQQSSAAPNFGGLLGGVGGKIGAGLDKTFENVGVITGKVLETTTGVVSEVSEAVNFLLNAILKEITKDIKPAKIALDELLQELGSLAKEEKEKVEAATAEVTAVIEEFKAIHDDIVKILNNPGKCTVELIEKFIVRLIQLKKKIIALLNKLPEIIEAILQKCDEDTSPVLIKIQSIIVKVIKLMELKVSKIIKFLEFVLGKLKGAAENTSNEFKSSMAKLMENCDKYLAAIDKAAADELAKAEDAKKEAIEEFKKTFMDSMKNTIGKIHANLAEVCISGDKDLMTDVKTDIEEAIAAIKDFLKSQTCKNLDSSFQVILVENLGFIMGGGEECIKLIKKQSGQ